jgi:hypothetical protein
VRTFLLAAHELRPEEDFRRAEALRPHLTQDHPHTHTTPHDGSSRPGHNQAMCCDAIGVMWRNVM